MGCDCYTALIFLWLEILYLGFLGGVKFTYSHNFVLNDAQPL